MNTKLPPASGPSPFLPDAGVGTKLAGSLSDYFFELAQQALNKVDPVPPAPSTPTRAVTEAQAKNREPAGSPDEVCIGEVSHGKAGSGLARCALARQGMVGGVGVDWATDVRPSYKLSDAELLSKMDWLFQALCKRERQFREFDVPTVFPAKDQS